MLSLAKKVGSSPSLNFQLASAGLMFFQSFASPLFIGLEAFGYQMFLLSPVLLALSIFEASYQAEANSGRRNDHCVISAPGALIQFLTLIVVAALFGYHTDTTWLLIGVAVSSSLFMAIGGVQFSLGDIRDAALLRYAAFFSYIAVFLLTYRNNPHLSIVISNFVSFGLSAIIGIILIIRGRKIKFLRSMPKFSIMVASVCYRLPAISFVSIATIILGALSASSATIGEFRIYMAAIASGRYFNVVPVALIQTEIHRYLNSGQNFNTRTLRLYVGCYIAFLVVISIVFPILFDFFYGNRTFIVIFVSVSSLFLFLQPLNYFLVAAPAYENHFIIIISIMMTAAASFVFWAFYVLSLRADIAASAAILFTVAIYTVLAQRAVIQSRVQRQVRP